MKFKRILDVFQEIPDPGIKKFVCAPCSNCEGQFRDLFSTIMRRKNLVFYKELVELIVNAMVDLKEPYIKWE